jgi:hypothetical protein
MKRRERRPTIEDLGNGDHRIRVPAGYYGMLPEELIEFALLNELLDDLEPQPVKQGAGQKPSPALSPEERRAEHERRRTAALMRVARSQRQLDALLENEGIPLGPRWTDQGQATAEDNRRRARERTATYTIFKG